MFQIFSVNKFAARLIGFRCRVSGVSPAAHMKLPQNGTVSCRLNWRLWQPQPAAGLNSEPQNIEY
jgi:hypothetical protein